MFKHKKIVSAILAVAMLGAMSTSVFASFYESSLSINSYSPVKGAVREYESGKHEIDITVDYDTNCTMATSLKYINSNGTADNIYTHNYTYKDAKTYYLTMGGKPQPAGDYYYYFNASKGDLRASYLVMHTYTNEE